MSSRPTETRPTRVVRLSPRRRLTLPADILGEAGIRAGDNVRVEVDGPRIVLSADVDSLARFAGALSGLYPPGYLDELRDEWERHG